MGLVGYLRFSLLCLDFLAWPAFALVYPLWASIRAIETSSKYDMKKLVTYWTIFSLISLFEIFFVKLIEWVPFWPYIRLVAVCWLVIPRFNGACHVYQHLIHPCLSVNPKEVINCFSIAKDKTYSEDSFLASAETYLKENGPEALEKLIASKAKHKEQILTDAKALEVAKRIEPTKENITAEEQLVEHPKLHPVDSEKKEVAAPEVQRVTTPTESKEKGPSEIPALKKVQREWTCDVCQLTTQSEATFNSHLIGRKHRSNSEKLKNTETTKNMQSSAAKDKSNTEELKTSIQTSNDLKSSSTKTNDSNQSENDPKICLAREGSKQITTIGHADAASGQQQIQEKPKEMTASVEQQAQFWCNICNITCMGEINMANHLKGRKHLKSSAKQTDSSNQTKNDPEICLLGERSEQLVEHQKLHLVESEKKEDAAPEAQRVTMPMESKEKRPSIPALKNVQREWTCAVCQLTTQSEATLNSHLLGRKHRSNCEKLRTNTQTTKNMQSLAAKDKSNTEELKTSKQTSNDLKSSATKTNDSNQTKNDPKISLLGEGSKQNTTEKPRSMHINAANGQQQLKEMPKEMNASVNQQPKLWCSVCNISVAREMDMACHLIGKKHLKSLAKQKNYSNHTKNDPKICPLGERSEQNTAEKPKIMHIDATSGQLIQQPNLWCSICNITCTREIDMAYHLNGSEHFFNMQMISSVGNGQPSYFMW